MSALLFIAIPTLWSAMIFHFPFSFIVISYRAALLLSAWPVYFPLWSRHIRAVAYHIVFFVPTIPDRRLPVIRSPVAFIFIVIDSMV